MSQAPLGVTRARGWTTIENGVAADRERRLSVETSLNENVPAVVAEVRGYEKLPNREDLAADYDLFLDSILEPVPMPRWLRGRRRVRRDKLSSERRGAR